MRIAGPVLLVRPLAADAIQIRHDNGQGQEVALTGFISNLLASFEAAFGHYAEYNRTRQDVLRYVGPFGSYYNDEHGKSVSVMDVADEKQSPKDRYNTFVSLLQESAWTKILSHPGFQSILTERARTMMKEFHLHEDNRVYFEGWKSNKAWKVSRKVVLPYYIDHWSTGTFHLDYRRLESLSDIDRAMCVVSKRAYGDAPTAASRPCPKPWRFHSATIPAGQNPPSSR